MNKRLLCVVMLIVTLLIVLGGCDGFTTKDQKLKTLTKLNGYTDMYYGSVSVNVKVTNGNLSTTSIYGITVNSDNSSTVNYNVEQYSTLSIDSVNADSYKFSKQGTVTIDANGKVISGDVAVGTTVNQLNVGFEFREVYFENIVIGTNVFNADVKDGMTKLFMKNSDLSATNMKLTVNFTDKLNSVLIKYTTANNSNVEIAYSFS